MSEELPSSVAAIRRLRFEAGGNRVWYFRRGVLVPHSYLRALLSADTLLEVQPRCERPGGDLTIHRLIFLVLFLGYSYFFCHCPVWHLIFFGAGGTPPPPQKKGIAWGLFSCSFLANRLFVPQAGVPYIPHGRGNEFYSNLLDKKKLPPSKRPQEGQEEKDADVLMPKRKQLRRRPRQSTHHREAGGPDGNDDLESGGESDSPSIAPQNVSLQEAALEELERMLDEMEPGESESEMLAPGQASSSSNPLAVAVAAPPTPNISAEAHVLSQPCSPDQNVEAEAEPTAAQPPFEAPPPPLQPPAHTGPPSAAQPSEASGRSEGDFALPSGHFGVFRFTRTPRGFSARCPFHRRNPKTDCKKMISVTTPKGITVPQQAIVLCWRRLAWWCLRHKDFSRQREHVDWTPPAVDEQVPGLQQSQT